MKLCIPTLAFVLLMLISSAASSKLAKAILEKDALPVSTRATAPKMAAAFILCEKKGAGPTVKAYSSTAVGAIFTVGIPNTCKSALVSGAVNNRISTNHALLWPTGEFSGLVYYYERVISCAASSIGASLILRIGTAAKIVYTCDPSFEAHVVTLGI